MRKLEKVAFLLCCLALLCVMGVGAWSVIDKGDAFDDYKDARPAFGYLRYETLSFAPTEKKDAAGFKAAQEKAAPVLEEVQTAVSYTGTQASQCPVDTRLQSLCYCNAARDASYTLADSEVTFVAYRELLERYERRRGNTDCVGRRALPGGGQAGRRRHVYRDRHGHCRAGGKEIILFCVNKKPASAGFLFLQIFPCHAKSFVSVSWIFGV